MKRFVLIALFALVSCRHRVDDPLGLITSTPIVSGGIPTFNVKLFGAIGDGVHDDRPAIAATMAAACASSTPAEIFFPPGTYSVSRTGTNVYSINVACSNLTFAGVSHKSIIQHPSGMPNAVVNIIYTQKFSNLVFRDLVIDGNWQNASGRLDATMEGLALPQSSIALEDASDFPSAPIAPLTIVPYTVMLPTGSTVVQCTGKSGNSLTGCSGGTGTLHGRVHIGYVDASNYGINHTTQSSAFTTIAAGSDGATLPQSVISVADATKWAGSIPATLQKMFVSTTLGWQTISCTSSSVTAPGTLSGCTGGTGTLVAGLPIFNSAEGRNFGLVFGGSSDVTIEDVQIKRIYGDCMYFGVAADFTFARNIRISRVSCTMTSRNALTFGSAVEDVSIDNLVTDSISAQAVDCEPVAWPIRRVNLERSSLVGWWNLETHGPRPLSIAGASSTVQWNGAAFARDWRVHDNYFEGAILVGNASDVSIENNRLVQDFPSNDSSTIDISGGANMNIVVRGNSIYTRNTRAVVIDGGDNCCAIRVSSFFYGGGTGDENHPTGVHVLDNDIHVRNQRDGIAIIGSGGAINNYVGTAATVSSTTITVSGTPWTTNQWLGRLVTMGRAYATVSSSTTNTLNLSTSRNPGSTAWADELGNLTATPALGGFSIGRPTGVVEVAGNRVEGADDGYGKGHYCYFMVSSGGVNAKGMRVRFHDNVAHDCNGDAFRIRWDGVSDYPHTDVSDFFAYDDLATHTTTNAIDILHGTVNAINTKKLVLRNIVAGEGVTTAVAGLLSTQTPSAWLVRDGSVQTWEGWGSPEGVVTANVGSVFLRRNGGALTSRYQKESNSGGNTGWIGK